jgi:hypothetical protein
MNRRLKTSLKDDNIGPNCQGFQLLRISGPTGAFLTHPDGVIEYGHHCAAILLDGFPRIDPTW